MSATVFFFVGGALGDKAARTNLNRRGRRELCGRHDRCRIARVGCCRYWIARGGDDGPRTHYLSSKSVNSPPSSLPPRVSPAREAIHCQVLPVAVAHLISTAARQRSIGKLGVRDARRG